MTQIDAKIVADSINIHGDRITTYLLTYPRIIHAELMTHRMFSRNASSSRAVPIKRMIESVRNNMFIPLAIQKSHKGMQGEEYFTGDMLEQAKQLWIDSAELALQQAEKMSNFGITKQLVNRILEPYQYYQVLVTATEYDNFFDLRCPRYDSLYNDYEYYKSWEDYVGHIEDYQTENYVKRFDIVGKLKENKGQSEIHIMNLAEKMWNMQNETVPKKLKAGEWHIPFIDAIDKVQLAIPHNEPTYGENTVKDIIKVSIARCARTSYTTVGDENKEFDYESDIKLYDKLLESGHMSPFEHVARTMTNDEYYSFIKGKSTEPHGLHSLDRLSANNSKSMFGWCNNFKGFVSYRYIVESIKD